MKPFELLHAPLEGVNLIEAGAGTGKTYNIEGLFVRLILEAKLQVEQILVLTFTNAATEELKDRIRHKLVLAREDFNRGTSDDPFIASLIKSHPDSAAAGLRVHETLIDFDKASIFTIHGFCQRVLHENAFETHNLFDTELITNQSLLLREVADDFWRRHFYHAPVEFIGFALSKTNGPDYFCKLLDFAKNPEIKILPVVTEPSWTTLQPFRESLSALKRTWPSSREAVMRALADPGLNAVIYGSLKPTAENPAMSQRDLRILTLVDAMDRLADEKSIGFPLFEKFERLSSSKLNQSTKKNHRPPRHDFFDLCDQTLGQAEILNAEMEARFLYLKTKLFPWAASELIKRKKEKGILFFDDLLVMLHNALRSEHRNLLENAIRHKYKAALVDEFQDTDGIQYEILYRLFAHQNSLMFMIGDPKQAIYSFRGADIFSYMRASRNASNRFSLTENWRSRPGLIDAVNAVFSGAKLPFVFEEIPFERAKPADRMASQADALPAPFILWYLDAAKISGRDRPMNKEDAVHLIAHAVGNEIDRLISRTTPVAPGDIAVLVRTNVQAQLIKSVLSSRAIPSVLYSTDNIFDSGEAAEMEKILIGIFDPTSQAKLKAAMATDMMGVQAEDMIVGDSLFRLWENRTARFIEYHRLWERYGFIRMLRQFLVDEHVKERLLRLPDGERKLTNVLHLAEILHRQTVQANSGMAGLLKFLADQRDPGTPRLEEHQLRLESDEKAVKIVTIHKSKGLEYPVVFCPFAWEGSQIRGTEFTFHDIDDDRRLTLDLGSESSSRHRILAQDEALSENLRLLYVALTRAQKCCYLAWGRISTAETSALAYLLHCDDAQPAASPIEDITQYIKKQFSTKSDAELMGDLNRLLGRSKNAIRIAPLPLTFETDTAVRPPVDQAATLYARHFNGNIDHFWKISSYSSLVAAGAQDADLPDRDLPMDAAAAERAVLPESPESDRKPADHSIFSFPRGTRAGIFFHDIMEHCDFAAENPADMADLASAKLQQYGFDQKWQAAVCAKLKDVFSIALRPDAPQLKLSAVQMKDRINEMEFYFPLNPVSSRNLATAFSRYGHRAMSADFAAQIERLNLAPSRGFMKGYIDLVFMHQQRFYLVDWKSNYLGPNCESYSQVSLQQTMQAEYYILQYHLYTLALHLHLSRRKQNYQYEPDFGGIFYIFLRGVDTDRGSEYGIFFDRPNLKFIDALGRTLIPGYPGDQK